MGYEVIMNNVKTIERRIAAEQTRIRRNKDAAAKAGARALVPFVKAALPRDSKSSRPGYLRSHVKVFQDIHGEGLAKVKLTGTLAHLVFGDVKEHKIQPRGMADVQVHRKVKGARMQGPSLAKRAISFGGNAYASALHPAHTGATNPLNLVRTEHAAEARLAAAEALRSGH